MVMLDEMPNVPKIRLIDNPMTRDLAIFKLKRSIRITFDLYQFLKDLNGAQSSGIIVISDHREIAHKVMSTAKRP